MYNTDSIWIAKCRQSTAEDFMDEDELQELRRNVVQTAKGYDTFGNAAVEQNRKAALSEQGQRPGLAAMDLSSIIAPVPESIGDHTVTSKAAENFAEDENIDFRFRAHEAVMEPMSPCFLFKVSFCHSLPLCWTLYGFQSCSKNKTPHWRFGMHRDSAASEDGVAPGQGDRQAKLAPEVATRLKVGPHVIRQRQQHRDLQAHAEG